MSRPLDLPVVDPDIRRAETMPGRFYADPELFAIARERVFAPSWQAVGDLDQVKVPGQVHPFSLLDGLLSEPLLLTRDRDDHVHCLSNVCTHRGTPVCEGDAVENFLRCRYHGRRFGLDGRFLSMPEFESVENFPSERDHLARVAHGGWGKLVFASLAPAMSLETLLAPMDARCGWMKSLDATFDATRARDYLVRAHWALYVENYLEGFHIPYVHAGLAAAIDYGEYRTDLYDGSTLQLGVASGDEDVFELPRNSPDYGKKIAAYWWWLFPNTMLNFYPWGVSVNVVRPLGPDLTRVSFLPYVWDASRLDRGAGGSIDRVEREDEAVVESVQRGMRSRLYTRGRYSPTREQGVHHFHRMLLGALTGS